MTDTDGPFDTKPWAEAQWARHAAQWASSGVYGAPAASTTTGDLPLSVSGLSVGLGAGRAWVRGFGFERTGAAVMQAVSANTHGSFSRRDRIVLRRNLATHTITPVLLTGTPSGSPAAPTLTQSDAGSWDLPMFSFLVPPNSGTSITGIVDERSWLSAGWVTRLSSSATYSVTVSNAGWEPLFFAVGPVFWQATADVPSAGQLEAEWSAPLCVAPAGTGLQVRLRVGSTIVDSGYVSADTAQVAVPMRLGKHLDFAAASGVALVVEARRLGSGAGNPRIEALAEGSPVTLRSRFTS